MATLMAPNVPIRASSLMVSMDSSAIALHLDPDDLAHPQGAHDHQERCSSDHEQPQTSRVQGLQVVRLAPQEEGSHGERQDAQNDPRQTALGGQGTNVSA